MATTRYRLTSDSTAPAVSPAFQSYTHNNSVRRRLLTTDTSALTNSAYTPDGADHLVAGDSMHIQFVSNALAAGIVYDAGNAVRLAIQGLMPNNQCNQELQLFVSVVNSAGTQQAVLRSKVSVGAVNEFFGTLRSVFLDSTLDGSYTTALNDRLVAEISTVGTPTSAGGVNGHNATMRWGGNGAGGDLPQNNTEAGTTFNPWFEIEDTPSGETHERTIRSQIPSVLV